ncbi:MAG: ferrochelatase [Chlamydiales bacterium]
MNEQKLNPFEAEMGQNKVGYIIANFGGPRSLDEISPFLVELLTDQDVLRTPLPKFVHRWIFSWIAKRRALKVRSEYESMGGKSPIYEDTECVASAMREHTASPILTFHRYLPATHDGFLEKILKTPVDEWRILPLFPQFTYATTGSIARWFLDHLPQHIVNLFRWIKSYPCHPSFVESHVSLIKEYLQQHQLEYSDTILLFSAHGIPKKFIDTGDVYEQECRQSFEAIMKGFPGLKGRLSFQSKFGPGEWLRPYTIDVCERILEWNEGRKNVVFIPISFTSDHIETLCEIENDYMTVVQEQGLNAYRVPALNQHPCWIKALREIIQENNLSGNKMLLSR